MTLNGKALCCALLCAALEGCISPAWAETADDLQRVEQKLSQQKAEAEKLERKEKETAQEIGSLQQRLVDATEALRGKQDEQEALKERLRDLERDINKREEALSGAQSQLGSMAEALLRFSRQPPEVYLLNEPLTEDNWHRSRLLAALLPRLERQTAALSRELDELEKIRQEAADQRKLVTGAQLSLAAQRNSLDQLVKTRQRLLEKTVAEKAMVAQQMESLAEEAKDLRQLMEKVSHSAVLPKNVKPPPLGRELKTPVNGRLVKGYGTKDEFGVTSQGVTLKASAGSLVIAPQGGRVAFAGTFRGYGQIVILQHGEGYHSFLAGFGRIDANVGQIVAAGEPLGVLPDKGDSLQELYFEWRHNGEPVNPSLWKGGAP